MQKKILVVDDDKDILEAIQIILSLEGYEVVTLAKGREAFKKASKDQPDLILLDVLMSGVDGRDICKQLKATNNTKHIPVVMVSAHPSAKYTALDCGASDFVAKPFDIEYLLKKVSKYVSFKTSYSKNYLF